MLRSRLQGLAKTALCQLRCADALLESGGAWQMAACSEPQQLLRLTAGPAPAWQPFTSWRSFSSGPSPPADTDGGGAAPGPSSPLEPRGGAASGGSPSTSAPGGAAAAWGGTDAAVEEWGRAMEAGDWERAWEVFEGAFPVDTPEFPPLEELVNWDPDEEEKAQRRQRERGLQEEYARARVRRVDASGRAHAVGKRKTAVARVWLREGTGAIVVNRRPFDQHVSTLARRNDLVTPFIVTDTLGRFDVMAAVEGGGVTGQAQALRHGIARALQAWDPLMRPELKAAGLLTRDARIVERKKPGRKKARKSFQWVKR
jgi:small subunit ribosomal protein S9